MKYPYLHKFIIANDADEKKRSNWFKKVTIKEIEDAENAIGFQLPKALKEFWLEIGYGSLCVNMDNVYSGLDNNILAPDEVVKLMLRYDDEEGQEQRANNDVVFDILTDDDIPFFESESWVDFLTFQKSSANPNSVYNSLWELVEEEFERFIWRLYHETANYYKELNIN